MIPLTRITHLLRRFGEVRRDITPRSHIPEHIKTAIIGLHLALQRHADTYLTAKSRAAELSMEADVWLAHLVLEHWGDDLSDGETAA